MRIADANWVQDQLNPPCKWRTDFHSPLSDHGDSFPCPMTVLSECQRAGTSTPGLDPIIETVSEEAKNLLNTDISCQCSNLTPRIRRTAIENNQRVQVRRSSPGQNVQYHCGIHSTESTLSLFKQDAGGSRVGSLRRIGVFFWNNITVQGKEGP